MIATFTLACRDPATQTLGIITASNYLAVGSLVPWIEIPHGLVVTQSFAHPHRAQAALAELGRGASANTAIAHFLQDDPAAATRQVAILPTRGAGEVYSGPECVESVEQYLADDFLVCGNMLTPGTINAVAEHFERIAGTTDLGSAMLSAMQAGELAGGDNRGKLAAAMLLKRPGAGYQSNSDTWVDLRVDAHRTPLARLRDLYSLFQLYHGQEFAHTWQPLTQLSQSQAQGLQHQLSYLTNQPGQAVSLQPPQLKALLAQHNLLTQYNPEQEAVSSLLLEQAAALPRLLHAEIK